MVINKGDKLPPLTESVAQIAVARFFDWQRNTVIPNTHFCGGEMDVCVITPAGYLYEVEIKTSLSDWNNDQHKDKWQPHHQHARQKVSRFYYAVPESLIERKPAWVPETAGLIAIYPHYYDYPSSARHNEFICYNARVVKQAKRIGREKIDGALKANLMRGFYWRYWVQIRKIEHAAA